MKNLSSFFIALVFCSISFASGGSGTGAGTGSGNTGGGGGTHSNPARLLSGADQQRLSEITAVLMKKAEQGQLTFMLQSKPNKELSELMGDIKWQGQIDTQTLNINQLNWSMKNPEVLKNALRESMKTGDWARLPKDTWMQIK